MGQAKRKQAHSFSPAQIAAWEADDCVNFAIALARITGWLLHVDWACENSDSSVEQMTPLRVYVGDNADRIFDVRGIKKIEEFCEGTIRPLFEKRYQRTGGVSTKFTSEEKLWGWPLISPPDEEKIGEAKRAIEEKQEYLKLIPQRQPPLMPAHEAAEFTFGKCAIYAEALHTLTGLQPTAMLVTKFQPMFANTQLGENGYVHSFILHPDGTAEDCWGNQTVGRIAERFGAIEYLLNPDEHSRVVKNLKNNSPDRFSDAYKMAEVAIKKFR